MATTCDYCGCKTNEVKSGAGISKTGIRISLKLTDPNDLSRDILKVLLYSYHKKQKVRFNGRNQ